MKIEANAKINLSLSVTGKLSDGYHTIETVMQSVDLHDTLTVSVNNTGKINVLTDSEELNKEINIAAIAAELFLAEVKSELGVDIFIQKRIPQAAGLGGGSADAAAVIKALNRIFNNPLDNAQLVKLALNVGADVPFCLDGGTCLATGKGEKLQSVCQMPQCSIVLVKNTVKGSTGQMYQKIDEIRTQHRFDISETVRALKSIELLKSALHNDFRSVCDCSEIIGAERVMAQSGAECFSLSGAGPVVFGIFNDPEKAQLCVDRFRSGGDWAEVCHPCNHANLIIE
ncbi:MAG: 4-(cytidine 5'-diphospho)-2-C-methyl-D-erythritol kinase [bacterium]|nr:4-(cytidine 5'-diphospho)-2-C-methyl-D-erythritol kinase [bacterium]